MRNPKPKIQNPESRIGGPAAPSPFRIPPSPFRLAPRGVTLIEVLISMFVLLIGLLGVGAMIPLGHMTIVETAKADRSGACGRAGLREVRVRRMLDVTTWRDINAMQITTPSGSKVPNFNGIAAYTTTFDPMDSYCIDPLLIGTFPGNATIDRFPAFTLSGKTPPSQSNTMKRVTLGVSPVGGNTTNFSLQNYMALPAATRIFTWRDDLAFDTTNAPKLRPQRIYRNSYGVVQAGFSSVPGSMLCGETDLSQKATGGTGGYSWMVTVTPAYDEMGLFNAAGAPSWSDHHLYTVSVVVFFRRDLSLPVQPSSDQSFSSERIANVTFKNSFGYGGGDIQLGPAAGSVGDVGQFLDVKRDDWLLLCGQALVYHSANAPAANAPQYVNYFRWYRVVAVDDFLTSTAASQQTQNYRNVTLAGPDWPILPTASNVTQMMSTTVYAVLMKGVVGVYSDTMALESDRLWATAP
jgi:prepilin-type N-terminal cleavage/methylation domain-containing protein